MTQLLGNLGIVGQFLDWTKRKLWHHFEEPQKGVYFYEGQVWWVALGKNIGNEMDSKHAFFERPLLVLKKYSKEMCFVLPLTTEVKNPLPWYQLSVFIGGKKGAINISQGRTISAKRFLQKEGVIPPDLFKKVCGEFKKQF